MKANELMIGDFVQSNAVPVRVVGLVPSQKYDPICVQKVRCSDPLELSDQFWTTEDEIFGIYLGNNLLKKNGWQFKGSFHFFKNDLCTMELKPKGLAVWMGEEQGGSYADFLFPAPLRVHQLQHVLRSCGLHELANNIIL